MSNIKKTIRRKKTIKRLYNQLEKGVKSKFINKETEPLTENDQKRISFEIQTLDYYIAGGKKKNA